jgi:DNA-binding response OmpR family regulator
LASSQRVPREALAALRAAYVSQLPAKARAIVEQVEQAASEAGAAVLAYHLAHRLASSAAMYDFPVLSAAARAVEAAVSAAAEAERALTEDESRLIARFLLDLQARADESLVPEHPLSVLLVDDDPDVLTLLSAHLAAAHISVLTASSGAEALARVQAEHPDVVVSDVRMPGMNGYELCRRFRECGHAMPFVFLSALSSSTDRLMGFWTGADEYLVKPTEPEELIEKVRLLGDRKRRLAALATQGATSAAGLLLVGNLAEVKLAELLQLVARLEEPALRITLEDGAGEGSLVTRDGQLVDAELRAMRGRKAFIRLLRWTRGSFRVERAPASHEGTMAERIEGVLLEGLAQLDEYRALRLALGDGEYLRVCRAEDAPERRFEEKTNEIIHLVERVHLLDEVVEGSSVSDLEALRIVASLIQMGVLTAGPPRTTEQP